MIIEKIKAMEKAKALIAVVLFVATLHFTAYTNEAKPEAGKYSLGKNTITPVLKRDSLYNHLLSFR